MDIIMEGYEHKQLLTHLAQANAVVYIPEKEIIVTYSGGTGLNAYDEKGHEVDYWQLGDKAPNFAALLECISKHYDVGVSALRFNTSRTSV